jgi:hypothetical protein
MNDNLLIPLTKQFEGQAKLILKGAGLQFIKPKFFNVDFQRSEIEQETYQQIDRIGYDKKGGLFGLPIWDTISLISPNYTADDGTNVPSQRLTLDIAIIKAENDRNIVKTKIAGGPTVKEYMSDGDYDITIRGSLISNYSNLPPSDLLNAFAFITTCPEAVGVESNFLEYMKVFSLVIEKPKIEQRQGARNIFDFELLCCSDTEIDLDA